MLLMPIAIVAGLTSVVQPQQLFASSPLRAPGAPLIAPPTNLNIVRLDSSLHVTWTPSSDPLTAWHVVSIWQGEGYTVQEQSKVVGRTGRAVQTNGLMPN